MNVKINQEETILVKGLYLSGLNQKDIAKKYGVTSSCIQQILSKMGVKGRVGAPRQTQFDENFFESIDTEEKAYWLGFIFADGSMNHKTYSLEIELSHIDKTHLEKLSSCLKYNKDIELTRKGRACRIRIHSKKMALDLERLGVVKNKTSRLIEPDIKDVLRKHFWRGVFDGDGWFCVRTKKIWKKDRLTVGYSSMSGEFTKSFKSFIEQSSSPSKSNILQRNTKNGSIMYQIIFEGKQQIDAVKKLYDNATVFLERKYDIARKYSCGG